MSKRFIAIAAACTLATSYVVSLRAAPVVVDLAEYQRTTDRDDAEGGLDYAAIYACEYGDRARGIATPAIGCAIAYDKAIASRRYDDALSHAVMGCEKYRNATACRSAARVPLYMGNSSLQVPVRYASELKRLAEFVCHSGERIAHEYAGDSTGRECSNLARHFMLAKDIEYRPALQPAARAYFEAAYDVRLAAELYTAACKRWGDSAGCQQLRIASRLAQEGHAARPSTGPGAASPVRVSAPGVAR